MEKNKYYTPDISEFHSGFQYEMYNGYEWVAHQFPSPWWNQASGMGGFNILQECINTEMVRLKYLDRQDIESEGWHLKEDNSDLVSLYFGKYVKYRSDKMRFNINYCLHTKWMLINFEMGTCFAGKVKNLSEFRRIQKMIGIK